MLDYVAVDRSEAVLVAAVRFEPAIVRAPASYRVYISGKMSSFSHRNTHKYCYVLQYYQNKISSVSNKLLAQLVTWCLLFDGGYGCGQGHAVVHGVQVALAIAAAATTALLPAVVLPPRPHLLPLVEGTHAALRQVSCGR